MTRNRQNGKIQIAWFAPTRLIISIYHHLIGQYCESGILSISASQSGWRKKMIRGANPAIWIFPFCRLRVIWHSMKKDSHCGFLIVKIHFCTIYRRITILVKWFYPELHIDHGFRNWLRTTFYPDFNQLALAKPWNPGWKAILISWYTDKWDRPWKCTRNARAKKYFHF